MRERSRNRTCREVFLRAEFFNVNNHWQIFFGAWAQSANLSNRLSDHSNLHFASYQFRHPSVCRLSGCHSYETLVSSSEKLFFQATGIYRNGMQGKPDSNRHQRFLQRFLFVDMLLLVLPLNFSHTQRLPIPPFPLISPTTRIGDST